MSLTTLPFHFALFPGAEIVFPLTVYVVLGHHDEHIGLLVSLKRKGLLTAGEYFVVGVDLEQYDAALPKKYLHGLLQTEPDQDAVPALQHYLGVVPSAPVKFEEFAVKVRLAPCLRL